MAKEHPRYADMDWPPWEFVEFPMMVYPGSADGGRTPDRNEHHNPGDKRSKPFLQDGVIVNSEEERRQVLGIDEAVPADPAFQASGRLVDGAGGAKRLATEADERAELIAEAERLGVVIDKRWSLARIQDAIDSHKAEVV